MRTHLVVSRARRSLLRGQRGAGLIEALAALVVLSVGLLGLLALSTNLIQENVIARHRVQASFLAEQLIGMAVADPDNGACYAVNSGDACGDADAEDATAAWIARAEDLLPGAADNPPLGEFDPADGAFSVTLQWRKASEDEVHNYVAATNIID